MSVSFMKQDQQPMQAAIVHNKIIDHSKKLLQSGKKIKKVGHLQFLSLIGKLSDQTTM